MKKQNLIISLVFLFSITSVLAISCTLNNEFILGEDINVCSGPWKYQNETNTTQLFDCDSSCDCRFTAVYPNQTYIVEYQPMVREGNMFSFNLTSFLTQIQNITGTYQAIQYCDRNKGFLPPIYFKFLIFEEAESLEGSLVGRYESPADITGAIVDEAIADFKGALSRVRDAEDQLREVMTEGGWLDD